MARDFDGLVAAVTGGASGIGAAVVTEFAAQGARVAVLASTTGTAIAVDGGMQDLRLRPRR